jgi:hypothetical protein
MSDNTDDMLRLLITPRGRKENHISLQRGKGSRIRC